MSDGLIETRTLRVGILGCGQVSPYHLLAWARCPGIELVAACDPAPDRARASAAEYGIPRAYESAQAMFENERLDLIDITSPRDTHAANVRLAMRHGVNALCEKPLCPTWTEAQQLVREVGGAIRVMVNENWRYRAYYRKIGEWIASGRLGRISHLRIALIRASLIRNEAGLTDILQRMPFTANEKRLLIAEWLIHELDVARSLIGELDMLAARIGRVSDDVIGDDTAAMLLQTPQGMPVVVEGIMCAAGHDVRSPDRLEIMGTRCSVLFENAVLRLFGAEEEEHVFDEVEVRQGGFDNAIRHFVDCVRSGEPFWTSAEDQLNTLKLVDRAYELAGPLRHIKFTGGA